MNVSSNFQLLWVSWIKVTKAEISFIIIEPIISFFQRCLLKIPSARDNSFLVKTLLQW